MSAVPGFNRLVTQRAERRDHFLGRDRPPANPECCRDRTEARPSNLAPASVSIPAT